MKRRRLAQAMVVVSAIAVTGCGGFDRQAKATTQGLKVSYEVRQEEFSGLRRPLQIRAVDTRRDKEIIGSGAKPTSAIMYSGMLRLALRMPQRTH